MSKENAIRKEKDGNMIQDDLTVYIAAGHPATRPEILRSLVSASNDSVRERLAENTNLPEDCLVELAADASASVRLAVAENCRTPQSLLRVLCNDENPDVRFGIASNSNMPIDILQRLWKDKKSLRSHKGTENTAPGQRWKRRRVGSHQWMVRATQSGLPT